MPDHHLPTDLRLADGRALSAVFQPMDELPTGEQVRAFLAAAMRRHLITSRMAEEIAFYEKLARGLRQQELDLRTLPDTMALAPLSDRASPTAVYLNMSYPAATYCLQRRLALLQRGEVGCFDYDGYLVTAPALRMLAGKEAGSTDPFARHTLAYAIGQRIAQIRSLPGAGTLTLQELVLRVAYSFRKPAFLLDARLPASMADMA